LIGEKMSKRSTAALANTILEYLWEEGADEIRCVHIDAMIKTRGLVFPAKGRFRHGCGFARSSWSDLESDAEHWCRLTVGTTAIDPADPYADLFLSTRRYLHGFSYGFARLAALDEAGRIFCHLSQAMGPLAEDPVWIRLVEREKLIAGVNLKNTTHGGNRGALFGPGPKSLNSFIDAIG